MENKVYTSRLRRMPVKQEVLNYIRSLGAELTVQHGMADSEGRHVPFVDDPRPRVRRAALLQLMLSNPDEAQRRALEEHAPVYERVQHYLNPENRTLEVLYSNFVPGIPTHFQVKSHTKGSQAVRATAFAGVWRAEQIRKRDEAGAYALNNWFRDGMWAWALAEREECSVDGATMKPSELVFQHNDVNYNIDAWGNPLPVRDDFGFPAEALVSSSEAIEEDYTPQTEPEKKKPVKRRIKKSVKADEGGAQ